MTKKNAFTKDEWQMVKDGPEWVFAALAAADGNVALMIKAKESKAFKDVVDDYRSRSELMAEILEDSSKVSKDVKSATLSEAEQSIDKISSLLDAKATPAEAAEYRRFLLSVGKSIAEATGEGALGLGQKLSKKETVALSKIEKALEAGKKAAGPAKKSAKPAMKPTRPAITGAGSRPARKAMDGPMGPGRAKVIATHKVEKNQTLSHLALKYYGNATKPYWSLIHEFNKGVIGDNERNIWEGMKLEIPELPANLQDKK
jgi:nucleoid-associated protein YgaU